MMRFGKLASSLLLCLLLSGCGVGFIRAVEYGDTNEVLAQLAAGADVNARLPVLGTCPLAAAAARGHLDTVRLLLDRGAAVNVADLTGWTPLHAAAFSGDPEIIKLLLERGAVPTEETWYLPSPLTVAEQLERIQAIEVLKAAQAASSAPARPSDRSAKQVRGGEFRQPAVSPN